MSYPKKPADKPKTETKGPSKLSSEKRDKLLAIQEREQLKGMLVNKFIEKYGKDKKVNSDYISKQVGELMKNEKLTEENLKKLEQKISDKTAGKPTESVKDDSANKKAPSVKGVEYAEDRSLKEAPKNQATGTKHAEDHHDDAVSVASSDRPRSVYAQGDSDDEWATMMKYDTELFKKEKELEKVREAETKQRIKHELDRQITEKKRLKDQEEEERRRYNNLVENQMQNFDTKEKRKEVDMKSKIMAEKESRDKQLQDEHLRKKIDKRSEKELDELVVNRIKNELDTEAKRAAERRLAEKEHLRKVLIENEEDKVRRAEEAKREKAADVRAQQEYTRLIEKQENERAAELKAREDRAKKLMGMMADTVVKDQKDQIVEEERKLLKHTLDKEEREMLDEKARQQRLNDQKKDLRKYLDQQMEEKERRKQEEAELERRQAEIWKKDTADYTEHEKKKSEYLKDVNTKHADYLKKQIEADNVKHKRINPQELLLNKGKLKEIATKTEDPKFQKQLINPKK